MRLNQISIVGRASKPALDGTLIGCYKEEDLEASRQNLEQIIANHGPHTEMCEYIPATGRTYCPSSDGDDEFECSLATLHSAERALSRLNMRQHLALAFSNPSVARAHDLLADDLFLTEKYVHRVRNKSDTSFEADMSRDVLAEVHRWHYPSVAELRFRGLLIEDGWGPHLHRMILFLATIVLLLMVVGARFMYGDWGVAWTVGCFIVALAGLCMTLAGRPSEHH